jgi:hypothetical protein
MKNITVSRVKVEQWLEDLEYSDSDKTVIAAIKQALAAPVQEHFDGCVRVGFNFNSEGYFVYEETSPNEFCAIKGPFNTKIEAEKAMRDPSAKLIDATPPAAPVQQKPLFADIIAKHSGLAEELKAMDADAKETDRPWARWQFCRPPEGVWRDCSVVPEWAPELYYRRKPRTIKIGDIEVPEPLREAPATGTEVWVIFSTGLSSPVDWFRWANREDNRDWLQRGFCHLTEAAALKHAEALITLSGGKVC